MMTFISAVILKMMSDKLKKTSLTMESLFMNSDKQGVFGKKKHS